MLRLALCNEVLRELSFEQQCAFAAATGYDGLEIAPFTLDGQAPHTLSGRDVDHLRQTAHRHGVAITGFHWLLTVPEGLSITTDDRGLRRHTIDVLKGLISVCRDMGGRVLVHGSPTARVIPTDGDTTRAHDNALEVFAHVAQASRDAGVTYCLEPLSARETRFITRVHEAVAIVKTLDSPHFRTMIDASAAGRDETDSVSDLIRSWVPTGYIAHIHLNDTNRHAPGQGDDRFAPVMTALADTGYGGWASVEPFVYVPDGPATAARAIGYLRGLNDALTWTT